MPKGTASLILGDVCGAAIASKFPRSTLPRDNHLIQLMIEDDGEWHRKDFIISGYWIDDLIDVLQKAKAALDKEEKDA